MVRHIANASTLPSVWIKSSFSGGNSNCLEYAHLVEGTVAVRDSKHPQGPAFVFSTAAWSTFTRAVKASAFDR